MNMTFTIEDLHTIIDALDDTLIIQQAASLTHRSPYEVEFNRARAIKVEYMIL